MDANKTAENVSGLAGLKGAVKSAVKPVARSMWPLVEQAAQLSARFSPDSAGLRTVWSDSWNDTLDKALDTFAPPPGCTMEQYRALVMPTEYSKRHALVMEKDEPVALISVRQRNNFWEPVAYQVITGFIAPARDNKTLGRALKSLGMDIRIEAGLSENVLETAPTSATPYDVIRIDLQSDYQDYWNLHNKEQRKQVSIARKKCKRMHLVLNDKNDIEWIVNTWRDYWKDAPENEIVAAPDRIRFWNTLGTSSENEADLTVQVYTLYLGEERVAGMVATGLDGVLYLQCMAQLPEYRERSTGTRIQDLTLEHAAAAGFRIAHMGGGFGYKALWGPISGQKYGASYGPALFDRLYWVRED